MHYHDLIFSPFLQVFVFLNLLTSSSLILASQKMLVNIANNKNNKQNLTEHRKTLKIINWNMKEWAEQSNRKYANIIAYRSKLIYLEYRNKIKLLKLNHWVCVYLVAWSTGTKMHIAKLYVEKYNSYW